MKVLHNMFAYEKSYKCLIWILLMLKTHTLCSQNADTLMLNQLEEIILSDIKVKKTLPWSYTTDTLRKIDLFQSSLRNTFNRQVGIQAFNGENFAQDIRISMRGYGSRSAFGIRGIRVLMDGLPLTSPDGTTQMDELSILDVAVADVVRSGMAARLGNASGGVLSLRSRDYYDGLTFQSGINQFGSKNIGIKWGVKNEKWSNLVSVNHHFFNGKREFSKSQHTSMYNKTRVDLHRRWQMDIISGFYYSPVGQDPGALTIAEFNQSKFQSNARNKMFDAGESVKGLLVSVQSKYIFNTESVLRSTAYYKKRRFMATLPFGPSGWVDLDRDFVGFSNSIENKWFGNSTITMGQVLDYQYDRRKLFSNNNGTKGISTADQSESVFNFAIYQQWQWAIKSWDFHQMARWDINRYNLVDFFPADGLMDGQNIAKNLNGALGTAYNMSAVRWFSNVSTSFEMPTLNELTNNPTGFSGFNPNLKPERSVQWELGVKSAKAKKWNYSTTIFYNRVLDQISGYELQTFPGKTFYRNAASTIRKGMECMIEYAWGKHSRISVNYSYSDFRFEKYTSGNTDYSGLRQPMVPNHKWNLTMDARLFKTIDFNVLLSYYSKMMLNDDNDSFTDPSYECNMALSSSEKLSQHFIIGLQANNLFNLTQYSNFRANAALQRYYEAASPMHFGVFVKVDVD